MCQEDRNEQNWIYNDQTLQLKNQHFEDQCLTVLGESNFVIAPYDMNNPNQNWTFNQEVELYK